MTLPDQPPTFRPAVTEPQPWHWRLENSAGAEVIPPEDLAEGLVDQTFPSQADAESWVGEFWPELAAAGVDAVTLFEDEREVYGPMSLHA
jgi:hypothetical protein